MDKRQVQ